MSIDQGSRRVERECKIETEQDLLDVQLEMLKRSKFLRSGYSRENAIRAAEQEMDELRRDRAKCSYPGEPRFDPDCPACLRGLPHSDEEHAAAVRRATADIPPDAD